MYKLIFIVLCALSSVDPARILAVFPLPSISHQVVFRPITQALAKRGHEVVVVTTHPAFPKGQTPENLTEIDVHDVSQKFYEDMISKVLVNLEYGRESDYTLQSRAFQLFRNVVEVQMRSEQIQQLIADKRKFDLILIEAYARPAIIFSDIFKAPVIQVSSFGATLENLQAVGTPSQPLYYPGPFRQRLYNLTFWDKIREYYYHIKLLRFVKESEDMEDKVLQRVLGPNTPSVNELINNVDMLFLNVRPIWIDNLPVPPNVVLLGGLHQKEVQELPQDLKAFLDSSKNGVIYVSFGTNVHPILFPEEKLKLITESLSELPYNVLFKWNDDQLPGKPENVRISKWFPQSDLLRHPNVKAFIMQGGLQSTDEAITAGIPLICFPMFGDQWYNAEKYVKFKIGIKLDFTSFTKSQLTDAIKTVVFDKSYRENIIRIREQMYDEPQTPLERAIWWVEYVIRHGGARHLRAPSANVSWTEYYEFELFILTATVILLLITLIFLSFAVMFIKRFNSRFLDRYNKIKKS